MTSKTGDAEQSPWIWDVLTPLRRDFPGYEIWRDYTRGRNRYVARRLREGLNPHTVVTADLAELRTALEPARALGDPDSPPPSPATP